MNKNKFIRKVIKPLVNRYTRIAEISHLRELNKTYKKLQSQHLKGQVSNSFWGASILDNIKKIKKLKRGLK